jgi:hypothetical protein
MWFWFVLRAALILLLFSSRGYCGYRRSYYGGTGAVGLLLLFFILFWLAIIFAGPYWGWYGWWW